MTSKDYQKQIAVMTAEFLAQSPQLKALQSAAQGLGMAGTMLEGRSMELQALALRDADNAESSKTPKNPEKAENTWTLEE